MSLSSPAASGYRNANWLWLSIMVIALDQITKHLVVAYLHLYQRIDLLPWLNLVSVRNTGAAFSLFTGVSRLLFISLAVAVSIAIIVWLCLHPRGERLSAAGLSLIVGGAMGNVVDRALYGYVIDFIDAHALGWHWPAFNVADSAVTIGAVLLILDGLRTRSRERE